MCPVPPKCESRSKIYHLCISTTLKVAGGMYKQICSQKHQHGCNTNLALLSLQSQYHIFIGNVCHYTGNYSFSESSPKSSIIFRKWVVSLTYDLMFGIVGFREWSTKWDISSVGEPFPKTTSLPTTGLP